MRRAALCLLAACRFGFNATGEPAGVDDAATDVAHDAPLGPWSTPMAVAELSSAAADDDPTLTMDLLEIYFNSDRSGGSGGGDVWVATRTSPTGAFGALTPVAALNTAFDETTPEISGDGLTIYFSSNRPGGAGQMDIYVSTRASRTGPWSAPVRVAELASSEYDESPCVDAAGTTIFFDSDRITPGTDTIFHATRANTAQPWSTPIRRTDLDGSIEEENPYLDASGLTIWLTGTGAGGHDLFVATRSSPGGPFGAAVLDPVSSPDDDTDQWVSADGRTMYLAIDRAGNAEIYSATRQ